MLSSGTCKQCGIEKPHTPAHWQRNRAYASGYATTCKRCANERDRQRDPIRRQTMMRKFTLAAAAANHRARQIGLAGQLTTRDILSRFARQGGRCYWCQQSIWKRFELDHIKPLGDAYWCGDNAPENVCLSCRACNRSKRDLPPVVYAGKLAARGIQHHLLPADVPVQLELFSESTGEEEIRWQAV